jgi:hypothetical protein
MALEAFGGKMVFSGGSGVILEFLKWLEGFGAKDRGSCEIWEFLEIFVDFLECLEGLGPGCNYFLKPRVPAKSPGAQGPRVNLQQAQGLLC